ncbi:ABC transporter permease [Spirosoma gilvum]
MTTSFLSTIKAEFLKSKGSYAYWLTLLGAFFIPVINFIILIERPEALIPKFQTSPWVTFFRFCWKNVAAVILPMYIILITNLVVQIEYRNNTWKQVYAMPRTFADIFFSKFVLIHTLVLLFIALFNLALVGSGLAVHQVNPNYPLLVGEIQWDVLLTMTWRIYLGSLAIIVVQYWLSLLYRNFVVPLGIGIGLWLAGIVLIDWESIVYYPYVYPAFLFFTDFDKKPEELPRLLTYSVVAFCVTLSCAYLNISTLQEKG